MEGDLGCAFTGMRKYLFQSTPSAWRETKVIKDLSITIIISIHSLRVEGDEALNRALLTEAISIHSLRVEGDSKNSQFFTHLIARKVNIRQKTNLTNAQICQKAFLT